MKGYFSYRFFSLLILVLALMSYGAAEAVTLQIRDNPTGGDCADFGQWDRKTKTCTLTADLWDPIEISSNGVTLNGNGYAIRGIPSIEIIGQLFVPGSGVILNGISGVTVTRVTVDNYEAGIYLNGVTNARIVHNSLPNNYVGIQLDFSNQNEIMANDLYLVGYGIELNQSTHNTITGNVNEGGC